MSLNDKHVALMVEIMGDSDNTISGKGGVYEGILTMT